MKAIEQVIEEARKHNPCFAQFNKLIEFYEAGDLDNAWATIWGSIDWCIGHNILTKEDFDTHCTVAKIWYENRQLSYECSYVNGQAHGLLKGWYENGKPSYECSYVNGQKHGLARDWYSNGKPSYECNYVNGKKHSIAKGWHPNGKPSYERNYVNGQKHGLARDWYSNGQLACEYNYVNGILQ